MENVFLSVFIISVITNTVGFIYMYILIDSWKIYGKAKNISIAIYVLTTVAVDGYILYFLGTADKIAMGMALTNCIIGLLFLLAICKFKNGEVLFVYFSGIMFVFITNNIANVFSKYGTLEFLGLKIISDLFFIVFLYKYFRPKFLEFKDTFKSGWYMLTGLPVCICVTFAFLINSNKILYEDPYVKINCMLLSVTAVIAYTFIYFTMEKVIERERIIDSQRVMELELVHVEKYIDGLIEEKKRYSVFNHDLRHYANLISACVQNDDKQGINEALSYMYKEIDTTMALKTKKFCENSTINIIIAFFATKSEEYNIRFSSILEIDKDLYIEKMDLTILLSNCLENAINSCIKVKSGKEKKIDLVVKKIGKQLLITVENTKEGIIEFDEKENIPISKKYGHGIGSKSVRAFVNKYDGQINYEIRENTFKIKILI